MALGNGVLSDSCSFCIFSPLVGENWFLGGMRRGVAPPSSAHPFAMWRCGLCSLLLNQGFVSLFREMISRCFCGCRPWAMKLDWKTCFAFGVVYRGRDDFVALNR